MCSTAPRALGSTSPHRRYGTVAVPDGRGERDDAVGQSTVEFALVAPLMVLCAMTLLGTVGLCVDIVRLDTFARSVVRAAIVADDPVVAAREVSRRSKVEIVTKVDQRTGLVTVVARRPRAVPIPLLGRFVPRITLTASATMVREPPIVLG